MLIFGLRRMDGEYFARTRWCRRGNRKERIMENDIIKNVVRKILRNRIDCPAHDNNCEPPTPENENRNVNFKNKQQHASKIHWIDKRSDACTHSHHHNKQQTVTGDRWQQHEKVWINRASLLSKNTQKHHLITREQMTYAVCHCQQWKHWPIAYNETQIKIYVRSGGKGVSR